MFSKKIVFLIITGITFYFVACPEDRSSEVETKDDQQQESKEVTKQGEEEKADNETLIKDGSAILKKLSDFISNAKNISVSVETGYDVVQETGQKIEFGSTKEVNIKRPDKALFKTNRRDGTDTKFVFDGNDIIFINHNEKVYGKVNRPGTLDNAIDYFVDELHMPLPLAELFSTDLPSFINSKVKDIEFVGNSMIQGTQCDHIAFRTDDVDGQVWIANIQLPYPKKIVLTYKNEEAEPQFWAVFNNWDFKSEIKDSKFMPGNLSEYEEIIFSPIKYINDGETK